MFELCYSDRIRFFYTIKFHISFRNVSKEIFNFHVMRETERENLKGFQGNLREYATYTLEKGTLLVQLHPFFLLRK